ncbi:MAG: AsmA-like C-terminal domain-containing protein [Campylobacteraceae bacterium]|nr:AsmA-like C-terminal domain-containing protein [Campylobacteraceae bacterium]
MINIISKIIKRIWIPVLFITVPLLVFVGILYKGIRIDNLSFSNIKISGLYIKLDKKLFVEINDIKTNSSVSKSNGSAFFDIDKILDMLPPIYTLFDTININNIEYGDESAKILYKDELFFVDSSKLTVKTKLEIAQGGKLSLNIEQILLKDFDIEIFGNLSADIKRNEYNFSGLFRAFDISGKLKLNVMNNIVTYNISSNEFKSPKIVLDNIRSHVKLNDEIAGWIYGRTKAASYQILSFEGKINLSTLDFYPKLINAHAVAKDINVTFHKDVPPANVKNARVVIGDNKIVFIVDKATYEGKEVDADVAVYNLLEGETGVAIELSTNAYFDDSINKILKGFVNIELPISQTSGNVSSHVNIDVKVAPINVTVIGNFILNNANISIANVSMFSPQAVIDLNNTIINFSDARLKYGDIFDISANGTLNASQKHMDATSYIHSVNIEAGNNSVIYLANLTTPFTLDIVNGGVKLGLEEFGANLTFGNKNLVVLNSLRKLYPYSQIMQQYNIKRGWVNFETSDFTNINGNARIYGLDLPLLSNNSKISSFRGAFNVQNKNLHVKSSDNNILFDLGKSINIALNNLDVLFDANSSSKIASDSNDSMPIYAKVLNGNIKIANSNVTILSENLSLHVGKNSSIAANLTYENGEIELLRDKNHFSIYAVDVKGDFVNRLVNKEFFSGGTFSSAILGNSEDDFSGTIAIRGTKMKDFKTINNIIAFLNTIPALATLSDPKYSSTGFSVKSGIVEFSKMKNLIHISTLFLEGYSSDITGFGYVDLGNNEIYLDLRISTIKSLSNIISIIPLVNFIVLGEDGRIDIHIYVKGTLDDPQVETNIMEDTVMSPINIIKRVFQLPFYIFR